jgi:hypothetical protein
MALVKNTNSYVTVTEADRYFEDRLDAAAWTEASEDQKRQSLITASLMLNDYKWVGTAVSESQALAWPREGVYHEPKLGYEIELPETVPSRIISATYELAYHLLNNDDLLDDTGSLNSLSVDSITLDFRTKTSTIPATVTRLISPLFYDGGALTWWRAN